MSKGKSKYIMSLCLLILYMVFQAGTSVFPHTHIVDGEKMVHSHPYSSANHTHTEDQVAAIELLSNVQTLEVDIQSERIVLRPVLYDLEFNGDSSVSSSPHTHCVNLRAPPFC